MIEFLVVIAIFLAVWITIKLKYRLYQNKVCIVLLLLFALVAIPNILLTSKYAYLAPEFEGSVVMSFFLSFHFGVVLAAFFWTFVWISLGEAFVRMNLAPVTYFLFLLLFAGDLFGLMTWTDNLEVMDIPYLAWALAFAYTGLLLTALYIWKQYHSSPGTLYENVPSPQIPKKKKAKKK